MKWILLKKKIVVVKRFGCKPNVKFRRRKKKLRKRLEKRKKHVDAVPVPEESPPEHVAEGEEG